MKSPSGPSAVHLVINTHTASRLRLTLLGAARQAVKPTNVILTCDVIDESIANCAVQSAIDFQFDLVLVQRSHQGIARPAQVRNNAIRWLAKMISLDDALLVFLDGDCIALRTLVQSHCRFAAHGDVVIGGRVELTAEQTASLDEHELARPLQANASDDLPCMPHVLDSAQDSQLKSRSRRACLQSWLRRFGLTKAHKPKVVGANFAVTSEAFSRINGFDEDYEGWGVEDDDFARRAYADGARPVVAVKEAVVLHQHHFTRSRGPWGDNPAARRFHSGGPTRCVHGLENPRPQDETEAWLIRSSGARERVA